MEDPKSTNNKTCSCREKSDCPLNQNCLSECLVYNAVVNTSTTKNYYRTCEKNFKERYNNHMSSFRNIWELKENGENCTIDCLIAVKSYPCICEMRICDLCEKFMIARANSASLLNKRDELVSEYPHTNYFTLKCFKNK